MRTLIHDQCEYCSAPIAYWSTGSVVMDDDGTDEPSDIEHECDLDDCDLEDEEE